MRAETQQWRRAFIEQMGSQLFVEALFDRAPDIAFSMKDRSGRYVAISEAFAKRCGLRSKDEAIGRTAHELFPSHMADRYVEQDEHLFKTGKPVVDNLDLTLFNDRQPGWCLTNKTPIYDHAGKIIGLACLSKDLQEPSRSGFIDARFAQTIDHILAHFDQSLRIDDLAEMAGVSTAQFERRIKKIFQLSAGQFIVKTRIDAAAERLERSDEAIADIALHCGFCDQSALSRQFRQVTGLSPRQYRQWVQDRK